MKPQSKQKKDPMKDLDKKLEEMFLTSENGWKLCSSRADEISEKFSEMVVDELGNHPISNYEVIDDCACQISGKTIKGCGCECHAEIKKYIPLIKSSIKEALLAEMPKGYVAKDLDYKYIYYNQALTDCLEVIRKVLK